MNEEKRLKAYLLVFATKYNKLGKEYLLSLHLFPSLILKTGCLKYF